MGVCGCAWCVSVREKTKQRKTKKHEKIESLKKLTKCWWHLEPSDMCQHLRNKNDEEQPIRQKEDPPTTIADTNFTAVHREM